MASHRVGGLGDESGDTDFGTASTNQRAALVDTVNELGYRFRTACLGVRGTVADTVLSNYDDPNSLENCLRNGGRTR